MINYQTRNCSLADIADHMRRDDRVGALARARTAFRDGRINAFDLAEVFFAVGNALRYTTEPDSVFVGIRGGEETLRISVGSRGAVFSEGLRQSLFVPGHEGDHPQRGSGLGLYVSQRCALRHDGWIAFRRTHGFNVFTAFLHAPAAA
jgi:K+-sensing histidine kinase KdpD